MLYRILAILLLAASAFSQTGTSTTTQSVGGGINTSAGVVALFTACSGIQYLGADGACHNAATGAVTSVFTRTGDVVAASGDYTAAQVTNAAALNAANTHTSGTNDFTAVSILVPTQAAGDSSTKGASTSFVTTAINNAIAGVNPAVAVQAATTGVLPNSPTYSNGVAGIGATLTAGSNGAITVDGYTPAQLDRLLVKNQASAFQNGVYYFSQIGTGILPYILTRALDYDMPSDMNNTGAIPVVNGTANAQTQWVQTSQVATVGTDAVTFTQFTLNPTTLVTLAGAQALTNKDLTGAGNTFPTLNQNTTGSAAKWTTARTLAGNSVDGSANVAFTNKVIEQGTADSGFSAAQFLGALPTGCVWNTTSTGVLSTCSPGSLLQTTTTSSVATSSLCTTANCPAGTYRVDFILSEVGTGCTTVGSGVVAPLLSWHDAVAINHAAVAMRGNQGAANQQNMTLTTGGTGIFQGAVVVSLDGVATAGSDSIQVAATVTACTTPGSWAGYYARFIVTRIQ